jgi:hypothetical protein
MPLRQSEIRLGECSSLSGGNPEIKRTPFWVNKRTLTTDKAGTVVRMGYQTARKPSRTMKYTFKNSIPRQGGYVMVSVMALTLILIATAVAFMQWASDEANQGRHNLAGMQAYYLAQTGIVESGLTWLRSQQAGLLPEGAIRQPGGTVLDSEGDVVGTYSSVEITKVFGGLEGSNNFFNQKKFRISAVGEVIVPWTENGRKVDKEVKRKAVLYVSVRSFADYMYLSDQEETWNGETIRFFNGDTLTGRVHSNDTIHIMQRPVFFKLVSTSAHAFGRGSGYNPDFRGPVYFDAPVVDIPFFADQVREGANASGYFFGEPNTEYRADFRGSNIKMWYWEEGTPFDSLTAHHIPVNQTGENTCVFVEGPMTMLGEVTGAWTVGCSEDIFLIDDIKYSCYMPNNDPPVDPACNDYLGIVSEGRVVIANTWANGRENSAQGTSIIINAAIVCLGEQIGSFTFDQQNDTWESYICNCAPDNRGQIILWGSVTQRRRGYVHRSNRGSTGYLKDYKYDERFLSRRPPCFLDAVDQSGHALFNIVQWGQAVENPVDVRNDLRVRYN